ncbi:MAG: hypothetical protein IJ769_06855 [Clostridia bacterium]|nr:hypothetical protein [Clostridia bacterium]
MILYHYSVDSYSGGESLINDYKNQFRFAEPFMLALERNEDCFWSVFFAAMACSRELCALGLRKHENYIKDAVEGVFERVRRQEFSGCSASRLACVYYCESQEEALAYLKDDCLDSGDFAPEQVKLLEVDVNERRVFRYDQRFFNDAEAAMERRELDRVMALARSYFAMERSDAPLVEVLSDGENRVLRHLPIQ